MRLASIVVYTRRHRHSFHNFNIRYKIREREDNSYQRAFCLIANLLSSWYFKSWSRRKYIGIGPWFQLQAYTCVFFILYVYIDRYMLLRRKWMFRSRTATFSVEYAPQTPRLYRSLPPARSYSSAWHARALLCLVCVRRIEWRADKKTRISKGILHTRQMWVSPCAFDPRPQYRCVHAHLLL